MGRMGRHHDCISLGERGTMGLRDLSGSRLTGLRSLLARFRNSPSPILSRVFWALMGVMHASALAGALKNCLQSGPAMEGLGGCIALSMAMLFFGLKLGGVSFLRFRPGKRAAVAICLIVALIHIDCIHSGLEGAPASDWTALLATATLVGGLTRPIRVNRIIQARHDHTGKIASSTGRPRQARWPEGFRPHCWVLASRLFILRAPPV